MGQKVKRLKINRLSSENNKFDEILFHDGINLILGEKYDASTVRGRKTNGVGKSMCIEFIDFGFLCDYKRSRLYRIPEETFPMDEYIILDLEIGDEAITVKRNRKQADRPIIIRGGKENTFEKIADARLYLMEIVYAELGGKEVPSFRNLLSVLMRCPTADCGRC